MRVVGSCPQSTVPTNFKKVCMLLLTLIHELSAHNQSSATKIINQFICGFWARLTVWASSEWTQSGPVKWLNWNERRYKRYIFVNIVATS